jgi:hypothetical protein
MILIGISFDFYLPFTLTSLPGIRSEFLEISMSSILNKLNFDNEELVLE